MAALSLAACTALPPSPAPGSSAPASGVQRELATGLAAPWSMLPLSDGSILVSERDSGKILEVAPDGETKTLGEVPGVVHQGEGGLLGLAVRLGDCEGSSTPDPATGCSGMYAYFSASSDNRIVRMPLLGTAGNRSLGASTVVVDGIPKAGNHNGGRIAFGPDGMLYVGTGDAGNRANAQDRMSLGGKILRLKPDGGVPEDNPFPGSAVWSLGHRNVQGLAWDAQGRLWASEFGQNTWDELNQIQAGGNYGWPEVEGVGDEPGYTNPVLSWHTDEASPSGIAISGRTLYMAALRGERLWAVTLDDVPSAEALMVGALGRLRDVAVAPDGRVLVLTNNTDGRGTPTHGDDRIVEMTR